LLRVAHQGGLFGEVEKLEFTSAGIGWVKMIFDQ